LFGRFSFFIRYPHIFWLKWCWFCIIWMIKTCPHVSKKMAHDHVPLCSFIKKDSTGLTIFVQIVPYFNHIYNIVCSILWYNFLIW
jgi:hypothetical protein